MRAITSVDPPAANGTIKVMLRSGKSATAGRPLASSATVPITDLIVQPRGSLLTRTNVSHLGMRRRMNELLARTTSRARPQSVALPRPHDQMPPVDEQILGTLQGAS